MLGRELRFWYPRKAWQRSLWRLGHKTSIFPAHGYRELLELLRKKKFKAYVVTARYSFLRDDFELWLAKYDPEKLFTGYFLNEQDEQPHLFKEKIIKKLKLDYFVEDNWDIVNYLSRRLNCSNSKLPAADGHGKTPAPLSGARQNSKLLAKRLGSRYQKQDTEIHWIYNLLDRNIVYPHKHPYLAKFLERLTNCTIDSTRGRQQFLTTAWTIR